MKNIISIINRIPKQIIGTILLLTGILCVSSGQVYYGMFVQNFDPYFFVFISFIITFLFFLFMELFTPKRAKQPTQHTAKDWMDIFIINIITALTFISYFVALRYIEPAVVSSIEWGIGPVIALLVAKWMNPAKKIPSLPIIAGTGVLAGSFFLAWATMSGQSGILVQSTTILFLGLLFTFLSGVGNVAVTFYLKKLSVQGWNASKILAHRFYLIIIISGLIVWYNNYFQAITYTDLIWLLLITFIGTILPMYLMTVSMKYCSPFIALVISSLGPCFTFLFQLSDPRIEISYSTLIGVVVTTVFGFLVMFRNEEND